MMKRYDIDGYGRDMVRDSDGDWCKYEDMAELTAERDKYKAALERIEYTMARCEI